MIVCLNSLRKCPNLRLACISAYKWCSMMRSIFFRTLFEISFELNALSDAKRLIVSRICCIIINASYKISCECIAEEISVKSASDDLGKKIFRNAFTFYSFVVAWLLRIDINVDVGMLMIYFLICYMILLSALDVVIYFFHLLILAHVISFIYSFILFFHVTLFIV